MVEAATEYSIDVFDEGEVAFVQGVFLCFVPIVERNFFAVIDEARMLEAEFAF